MSFQPSLKNKIDFLKNNATTTNANWHQLKCLAKLLECLGEELEDNLRLVSYEDFNTLENLCETLILMVRIKSATRNNRYQKRREEWRRRVRYAAGFILNLIETAREEATQEDQDIIDSFALLLSKPFNDN